MLALLIFGLRTQSPDANIDVSLSRGKPAKAPPFRLGTLQVGALGPTLAANLPSDVQHRSIALSELRGTPVVLNFWASWCDPCQAEAPILEHIWRQQARPRGVLFLGVDTEDSASDARTFMRQYAIDYPSIRDGGMDVLTSYGTTKVPQTFFIDRQGQIVGQVFGAVSSRQLVTGIAAAITGRVAGSGQGRGKLPTNDALVSSLLAGIPQRGNTLGDPKAPVTVQYFGDLQCPACRLFTLRVLPSLIVNYVRAGKLKIEYHSLRTVTRNPQTFRSQQIAALAAGKQNKLWDYIELFYHEQGPERRAYVTEAYLQGLAQQVRGLNLIEWNAMRSDPQLGRTVTTDAQAGRSQGITTTPTFDVVVRGPKPRYLAAIEQQLTGLPSS